MDAMTHTLRNIFASALFAGILVPDAGAQVSYLERISCPQDPVRIVTDEPGKGGSGAKQAELSFTFDWDGGRIASQHTAAIVPVLVSEDGSRSFSFDPIFIDGRTRAKAVDRMEALSGIERPEGSIVLRPDRNGGTGAVEYVSRIQYDPAMLDGSIVFYETVSGCAGCIEGEDSLALDVLPRYVPEWRFSPSPAGGLKHRELRERADLKFIVNLHDINPGYADNAAVLDKVMNSIRLAGDSSLYTVTSVRFIGYASPDGPEAFNRTLALNRAKSLMNYVMEADEAIQILNRLLQQDIDETQVAWQISRNMNYSSKLELLHLLFEVAFADWEVCTAEMDLLQRLSGIFGISAVDFNALKAPYMRSADADWAYTALGIGRSATDGEVKTAYRKMAMKYHPDKLTGLGEDVRKAGTEKFRAVQEAYEHIKKERGMK